MKIKQILIISFSVLGLLFSSTTSILANTSPQEIDIATSPEKVFFNLINLKPGDTVKKTLTVMNKGKQDFNYLFTSEFVTGSNKFYDELLLTVHDEKGELFSGKLKDFKKLDSRQLNKDSSELLTFYIEIPYELGNDYQGLSTEFQFKFFVEGTLGGVLPADGPKLPVTGTEYYKMLLIGAMIFLSGMFIYMYSRKKKVNIAPYKKTIGKLLIEGRSK